MDQAREGAEQLGPCQDPRYCVLEVVIRLCRGSKPEHLSSSSEIQARNA